jgi:spermidine/putrescine-binding protein
MKIIKLSKEEVEILKRYKRLLEELKELEKQINALKELAGDESAELLYRGNVVAKILVSEVRRLDYNLIPKELKEKYVKISKERRLVITGIPSGTQ